MTRYNPTTTVTTRPPIDCSTVQEQQHRERILRSIDGFCGPYSVAYITGTPIDQVLEYVRHKYDKSPQWQGSLPIGELKLLMRDAGLYLTLTHDHTATKQTVAQVAATQAPNTWYIMHVSQHYVTMRNGYCIDQTETRRAQLHWTARKAVKTQWTVEYRPELNRLRGAH